MPSLNRICQTTLKLSVAIGSVPHSRPVWVEFEASNLSDVPRTRKNLSTVRRLSLGRELLGKATLGLTMARFTHKGLSRAFLNVMRIRKPLRKRTPLSRLFRFSPSTILVRRRLEIVFVFRTDSEVLLNIRADLQSAIGPGMRRRILRLEYFMVRDSSILYHGYDNSS